MQTATGALVTAQTSKEQFPECQVLADWRRDGTTFFDPGIFRDTWSDTWESLGDVGNLTRFVKSIRVGRELSTDLPEGVKTGTGFGAADATLVLGGNVGELSLTDVFAPYDNVLNDLAPRLTAPITISLGYRGTELLPQITGQVRGCAVDPDAGTVTLSVVDDRLRFRTPVVLPVVVADDHDFDIATVKRPGLTGGFLADWIARQQGYYQSPPVRSSIQVSATLCGSAWPEAGILTNASEQSATPGTGWLATRAVVGPATFGPLGPGTGMQAPDYNLDNARGTWYSTYHLPADVGPNTGQNIFIQFHRVRFTDTVESSQISVVLQDQTDDDELQFILTNGGGSATHITVEYNRPTLAFGSFTGVGSGYGNIDYIGAHIAFTATGAIIRIRVNGVETSSTVVDSGTKTGNAAWARAILSGTGIEGAAAGLQITSEPYTAGMWDDDFVPTAALEPSLNELTTTPTVDTSDPWVLEQQIADAEQAMVTFTEDGVFHSYNRNHLTGGAAVATITTDPAINFANLKSRASEEKTDGVRTVVSVAAIPWTLDPAGTVIWSLDELTSIPAGGTVRIPAEFPGPVYTLTTLAYRAAQTADGSGGDITNLVITTEAVTASTYDIVVFNPNGVTAWLVGNAAGGVHGEPTMTVTGRCTRPSTSTYTARRTAPQAALDLYGPQPLDIPATAFRQSKTGADDLADDLISSLAAPHPVLTGVVILGDIRLQLADRVRVADKLEGGLLLDGDFWLIAPETTFDRSSGLTQTVDLRQA